MDYFTAAFGGFSPQTDVDAAIKLVLNAILMDESFDMLAKVIPDGSRIGGIGGVPDWILQRRDTTHSTDTFHSWPSNATFRAHVDPASYELRHPEFFMDRATFCRYLTAALHAYLERNPNRGSNADLQTVLQMAIEPALKQ
jgi:hypothetical protein